MLAAVEDLPLLPGTSAEMGESKQLLPGHIHVVAGTQCNLNLSEIGCLNCNRLSQAAQSGLQPSQSRQQVNVLQRVTVYKGHRAILDSTVLAHGGPPKSCSSPS